MTALREEIYDFGSKLSKGVWEKTVPEKINDALASTSWDAIVVMGVENVQYFSGAWLPMGRGYLDRQNIVVWPKGGNPIYITGSDWLKAVQYASTNISKYVTYEEKGALPPNVIVDTLANVLHSEGLSSSCIGLEMLRTPVVFWKKLIELVPNAKFEEADATLRRLRMVKTAKEINAISTGARLTDDALWRGYSESKIGDTELDVARRITLNTLDNGCDVVTSMLLGTGEGAYALAAPTKRKLEPNSFVRQDMNSMLGGYYVDIGRMAFVGKPNSEQLKAYQDQVDFKYRIFDYMKPGITCEQVHAFYQETAKKMGIRPFVYPYIGLGHGTGVNNDEFPKLNFGDKTVLEPGMILNVEPDTLDPDGVVLHTEDMVLVTNDGIELITKSDGHDWKELFIISS